MKHLILVRKVSLMVLASMAVVSSSVYAVEDIGCGILGGLTSNECAENARAEYKLVRKAVLRKAVFGESYRCENPSKETWAVRGVDRNSNGALESSEVIRDSGHCTKLVFGKTKTVFEKLCDSSTAEKSSVGIDENLDGRVDGSEMHVTLSICKAPIVLTAEQIAKIEDQREAAIQKLERSSGYPGFRF